MKSEIRQRFPITSALILLSLLLPSILMADEACTGIGGTGLTASGCGVGGTGNSTSKTGIGGTGHIDSGIGGTGAVASKADGIGGTGHTRDEGGIGGTGIVGIITGFGSIWVNGLEVQFDAQTQLSGDTAVSSTNDLAIGEVVVIEAKGKDNALQAHKISVVNAVTGQISASADGKLTVLGQTVTTTAQTIVHDPKNQTGSLPLMQGDYVKVSGLRLANGEIVASRIERSGTLAESSLVGPISAINGNMIEIVGMQISVANSTALSIGQEVAVTGQLHGNILAAREISPSASTQLYGRTEHINLQGYVGASTAAGQIKIGNLEVIVSDPAIISTGKMDTLSPGELIQISGHFANDRRVIADRIEFSRDRPDRVQLDSVGTHEHDGSDRAEHTDRAEHVDRADHVDRPDKPDRSDHSEHHH